MAKILVVDDEKSIQEFFQILLNKEKLESVCVGSGEQAMDCLEKDIFDMVISDVSMPGISGVELLKHVKSANPETAVILITAYGDTESAVRAMKQGATDYILKPFKVEEIKIIIRQTLERMELSRENARLRQQLKDRIGNGKMIGKSSKIGELQEAMRRVATSNATVLITGESGTGKELVARGIHENSDRADLPFVTVNCGAIPDNLIESELFGYMRGAFTGATHNKRGLLEAAGKGTFFFDEVGELPLNTQVKLLRVLQEKKVRRLGDTKDLPLGCRIIAASNKDLSKEVERGGFREDLFYRLNVVRLALPALRERKEDIPLLIQHFIDKFASENAKGVHGFTKDALDCLKQYDFPGNIRELENIVEQVVAMATGELVTIEELPLTIRDSCQATADLTEDHEQLAAANGRFTDGPIDLDKRLANLEGELLLEALEVAGGVKKQAAKLLGISFRSMRYRLMKLGLDDD